MGGKGGKKVKMCKMRRHGQTTTPQRLHEHMYGARQVLASLNDCGVGRGVGEGYGVFMWANINNEGCEKGHIG